MKTRFIMMLSLLFISEGVRANNMTIEISALKDLEAKTQLIETISSFSGKKMMAEVASLPGQSYVFKSPINVQQVQYLKGNGANLKQHEAFAIIKGPEVEHLYNIYQMKKTLFEQTSNYFNNSKKLYMTKSLSEQAWLDISNAYHQTKMEYDELAHFFAWVLSFDDKDEALTLGAPVAGRLQYKTFSSLDMDTVIATFVPVNAIRLKINIPISSKLKPIKFTHENCTFTVDFIESGNAAFHQTAWAQSITEPCRYVIGQIVGATPVYSVDAFVVKQSSVFNWDGGNYIFVQNGHQYDAVQVTLMTATNNDYVVQSAQSLTNKMVLTSSVSAAQDILLGLGL